MGLSPHARGNRATSLWLHFVKGPIPACAGEPRALGGLYCDCWAYPRMRGGTQLVEFAHSPPLGLSPHARGNLSSAPPMCALLGPIPACAGEPALEDIRDDCSGAYPRMRGGTLTEATFVC